MTGNDPNYETLSRLRRKPVVELVRKDVEQYAKQAYGLVGVMAMAFAIPIVVLKKASMESYLLFVAAAAVATYLPSQLGQWLIVNERLQGTLRFLKSLPISEEEVAIAKIASAAFFVISSCILFCLLPFAVAFAALHLISGRAALLLIPICLFGLLNSTLCVALNLLFDKSIVSFLPFAAFALIGSAFLFVFDRLHLASSPIIRKVSQGHIWQVLAASLILTLWGLAIAALFKIASVGYRRTPP